MISITRLSKSYARNIIFDEASINILNNSVTFIMGENGSGKTTLIKSILQLEKYTGTISYWGENSNDFQGEIAAVYDENSLYYSLTGLQNIMLLTHSKLSKSEITNFCSMFLSTSDLSKKVSKYSYGQKKKLSICIAFLNKPKAIVMDEVSNGLDYETMVLLKRIIKKYSNEITFILTGHQFDFYNDIIDHLLIIKNRKITHVTIDDNNKVNLGSIYEQEIMDFSKK